MEETPHFGGAAGAGAREIERKFLVRDDAWRAHVESSTPMRQGYLSLDPERTVRVRVAGDRGTVTVKGGSRGAGRLEWEWEVPATQARELLDTLCVRPLVAKTRHRVRHGGRCWEIDEFAGENRGLVVAEVELDREDRQVALPPWAGAEVTGDARYYNASLVRRPFAEW